MNWTSIFLLERLLPNIEELYLANNNFNDILKSEELIAGFENLRILDLSNCQLTSWLQVLNFRMLPNLQEFSLDSNDFDQILSSTENSFNSLIRISLSKTK